MRGRSAIGLFPGGKSLPRGALRITVLYLCFSAEGDFGLRCTMQGCRASRAKLGSMLAAGLMMACGQLSLAQTSPPNQAAPQSPVALEVQRAQGAADTNNSDVESAKRELDRCHVNRVTSLPGSHQFASEFIVAMASDPSPNATEPNAVWGLTADLAKAVPVEDRAMYLSKSTDGGVTWIEVARIDSNYFDAKIGDRKYVEEQIKGH